MPLNLEQVHIFERIGGGRERLSGTNLYKMFERRVDSSTRQTEQILVQNGEWYTISGEELEMVPEWVWTECRAMTEAGRRMYGIVLPPNVKEMESDSRANKGKHG